MSPGTARDDRGVRPQALTMGSRGDTAATTGRGNRVVVAVTCAQCKKLSTGYWVGWRACRSDDPELDESPTLAFFCLECAEREFGA